MSLQKHTPKLNENKNTNKTIDIIDKKINYMMTEGE